MPSVYSSIEDFQASAVGTELQPLWTNLGVDALSRMLSEASDYADSFTKRKLGTGPSTTLSAVASNTNVIKVTNGANVHERDVAVFGDGSVVEVYGAELTFSVSGPPYVGTITLASNVTQSLGQTVTFYRQCQYRIRGKSTDPLDQNIAMSQQGQVALAHAPALGLSTFSRYLFVEEYPLWSVQAAYYTLPWTGQPSEIKADMSNTTVMRAGYVRLPIGFPNFQGSIWRIQYNGGYVVLPHDLRQAVHFLLAAQITASQNAFGGTAYRIDDIQVTSPGGDFCAKGQQLLSRYCRKT